MLWQGKVRTMATKKKAKAKPRSKVSDKSEIAAALGKFDEQIDEVSSQSEVLKAELKQVISEIDTIRAERDSMARKFDGQVIALSTKRRVLERMIDRMDSEVGTIRSEKDALVRKFLT